MARLPMDVTSEADCERVVDTVLAEQELIDALLINKVTFPVGAWCRPSSACFEGYSDPPRPVSLGRGGNRIEQAECRTV